MTTRRWSRSLRTSGPALVVVAAASRRGPRPGRARKGSTSPAMGKMSRGPRHAVAGSRSRGTPGAPLHPPRRSGARTRIGAAAALPASRRSSRRWGSWRSSCPGRAECELAREWPSDRREGLLRSSPLLVLLLGVETTLPSDHVGRVGRGPGAISCSRPSSWGCCWLAAEVVLVSDGVAVRRRRAAELFVIVVGSAIPVTSSCTRRSPSSGPGGVRVRDADRPVRPRGRGIVVAFGVDRMAVWATASSSRPTSRSCSASRADCRCCSSSPRSSCSRRSSGRRPTPCRIGPTSRWSAP